MGRACSQANTTLEEGYHTYNALAKEQGLNMDITLPAYKNSGKCSIIGSTNDLKLGRLGGLLGFTHSTATIKANHTA